jgi:hypothetical protein
VAVLGLSGCGRGSPDSGTAQAAFGTTSYRRLDGACDSPFELAQQVLLALERRDVEALEHLRVSEQEFAGTIWPELPASRPERHWPLDYVWGDLNQKSQMSLARLVQGYGGKRWRLMRVDFEAGSTRYDSYVVHRDSRVTVMDGSGRQHRAALFGSIVELDGQYKLMSYITD